jgi:hypothetical protein
MIAVGAPPLRRALAHIPSGNGLPLIGRTLQVLAGYQGYFARSPPGTGS